MRIGIVTYWFNRGQAVVGRHLRSALQSLGHDTFVLARLTKPSFSRPSYSASDDVWAQPGVTLASGFDIGAAEYARWARANRLDVVICFQNLQFDEIGALRDLDVRTVGCFMWEAFGPDDVDAAQGAYDVIYSLTRADQLRNRGFGIDSPYVRWGVHPELLTHATQRERNGAQRERVRFYYPGGYLTPRKPTEEALEAFSRIRDDRAELLIRAQDDRQGAKIRALAAEIDPRVRVIVGDLPTKEHLDLFRSADVSFAPSRWEGLGLHLFEAIAFGIPTVTNDAPPMNELVTHGVDGLLFSSTWSEEQRPGVPILEPDISSMAHRLEQMMDDDRRDALARGTAAKRAERSWDRTISDYRDLLARAVTSTCS